MVVTRIIAGCLLIGSAHAAIPPCTSWYADVNGGYAAIHKSYPGSVRTTGGGWSIAFGYKFLPYLAAELGYTHYPFLYATGNELNAKIRHYAYDLAAKAILPIFNSGVELFGKAGAGRLNSDVVVSANNPFISGNGSFISSNHYATSYYLAAGADYFFLHKYSINVQWAHTTGDAQTGNADLYTVGLSALFG